MQGAGIGLMESFDNDVHDNFVDGAEYGIRLSLGAGDNKFYDNLLNDISGGEIHEGIASYRECRIIGGYVPVLTFALTQPSCVFQDLLSCSHSTDYWHATEYVAPVAELCFLPTFRSV